MTCPTATKLLPIRDAHGNALPYVDPGVSHENGGFWFAYRADGKGWRYAGRHATREMAEQAAGVRS